jgi:hypothetical protein
MRQLLKITSIFALALVFTAGMAFGQSGDNELQIEQTGDDNFTNVEQVGEGNFSNVDLLGAVGKGDARVFQTGDNNTAFAEASGRVTLHQAQTGDNNTARIGTPGGSQVLTQKSTARQVQEGSGNTAIMTFDGPGTRFAKFKQRQIGDNNESYLLNFSSNSSYQFEGLTNQVGSDNLVRVNSDGPKKGDEKNSVRAIQMGHMNTIRGTFNSNSNRAVVRQDGSSNVAKFTQN